MDYDPGGVEQVRCHVLFDPFGVEIDFPVCTVGYTHGYSHSGPSGAGLSQLHTLIQQQWPSAVAAGALIKPVAIKESAAVHGSDGGLILNVAEKLKLEK